MESNSSINHLLECSVCVTFMYPPIHQCCNGHAVCFTCKARINNICPICREQLRNIRCIALEKLAELLKIPCKFHDGGCQYIDSYRDRVGHEEICSFRPYNCPYDVECSVTGDIGFLLAHLKESHSVEVCDKSSFNVKYAISKTTKFDNSVWQISIFNCFGHQFFIHFEACNIGNTHVFMAFLRFMGDESNAANFRYCLEVGGKDRKMTWEGIPRSMRENVTSVGDNLDGLIIQEKNLQFFFVDGLRENLRVTGRIWRCFIDEADEDQRVVNITHMS